MYFRQKTKMSPGSYQQQKITQGFLTEIHI